MSVKTRFIIAFLAAVLSAGAFFSAYYFYFKPITVVVAAKDFMPVETITPDGIAAKTISAGDLTPGTISNPDAIVGKTVGVHLFSGPQILEQMITGVKQEAGKTLMVVQNPISPYLSVGQKASLVAVLQEGPLTLGEVGIYSVKTTQEGANYVISLSEMDAPRFATLSQPRRKSTCSLCLQAHRPSEGG